MLFFADRVIERSNTSGTGSFVLVGPPAGFRGFVAAGADGKEVMYRARDNAGDFETGIGTVTNGTPITLSRDVILSSSNIGSPGADIVDFPAGQKTIALIMSGARPPALRHIQTQIAAGDAALDFTLNPTHYRDYILRWDGVGNSNIGATLDIRISVDGTLKTDANYRHASLWVRDDTATINETKSTGDTSWDVTPGVPDAFGNERSSAGELHLFNLVSQGNSPLEGLSPLALWQSTAYDGSGRLIPAMGAGGYTGDIGDVDNLRVLPSAGTITEGRFSLYGVHSETAAFFSISMAARDVIRETSSSGGNLTLDGEAPRGYQTFTAANVGQAGIGSESVEYAVIDKLNAWETGIGLISTAASGLLTRGGDDYTILASSVGGSPSHDQAAADTGLKTIINTLSGERPPSLQLILTQEANKDSTLDFTLNDHYWNYVIRFDGVVPSVAGAQLEMRIKIGGFKTADYRRAVIDITADGTLTAYRGSGETTIDITQRNIDHEEQRSVSGEILVHAVNVQVGSPTASPFPLFQWTATGINSSGVLYTHYGSGGYDGQSGPIEAVRFRTTSGKLQTGRFSLFGVVSQ